MRDSTQSGGCATNLLTIAGELLGDKKCAFHTSELWYAFGTLKRIWRPKTEADCALSASMLDCWAYFINHGNPNRDNQNK